MRPSPATAAAAGLTVPSLSTWNHSTRALARQNGWIELPWNEAAQSLARQNGWGPIPTANNNIWNGNLAAAARRNGFHDATDGWGELPTLANGIWNDTLTQAANAQGLYARANNVPNLGPVPFTNRMANATRNSTKEHAYLMKGCRRRTNTNQKRPGNVKIHYGRRTFQRTNGPITMTHLCVKRGNDNTRDHDHVYVPAMSRPTDQIRHAEYMADAMDAVPVTINGNRFHHSEIIQALDEHAARAHEFAANAIAEHDGHGSALAIGFVEP